MDKDTNIERIALVFWDVCIIFSPNKYSLAMAISVLRIKKKNQANEVNFAAGEITYFSSVEGGCYI